MASAGLQRSEVCHSRRRYGRYPVHPSPYYVWAAKEIVDLITEVRVIKTDLKAVIAVNRKIIGAAIGRDVAAALASYPVPVLETAISQWAGFAEIAAEVMPSIPVDCS